MSDIVYTIENSSADLASIRPLLPNGINASIIPNATGATLRIFEPSRKSSKPRKLHLQ